jgi:hypothetical protein
MLNLATSQTPLEVEAHVIKESWYGHDDSCVFPRKIFLFSFILVQTVVEFP